MLKIRFLLDKYLVGIAKDNKGCNKLVVEFIVGVLRKG